jgi:hypothetical protein
MVFMSIPSVFLRLPRVEYIDCVATPVDRIPTIFAIFVFTLVLAKKYRNINRIVISNMNNETFNIKSNILFMSDNKAVYIFA